MAFSRERVIAPEMLEHADLDAARENLRDLVRINRYFGGLRILRRIMAEFVHAGDRFTMLDVGAASGDMGEALLRRFPRAKVTALDRVSGHLANAAAPKLAGDAFALPFAPRSFDFVFSSLFLHHFSDGEIVELFSSFRSVARRAVVAIDLERGPLAYYFLPATRWLLRWHALSVHDGPVSVQAAFKGDELLALAQRAGLKHARVRAHRPWSRLSLVAPV